SPKMVIYDVEMLQTLSVKEVRSGYAELVKEALIADQQFFETLLQIDFQLLDNQQLFEHLHKGILIKKSIVERDEKESCKRMFLNIGHTFAHDLEAVLGYGKITIYEAVVNGVFLSLFVNVQ